MEMKIISFIDEAYRYQEIPYPFATVLGAGTTGASPATAPKVPRVGVCVV
jgi:hypothetical protein